MKVVLQNLTKIFPARGKKGGDDVVAVNDFSFEIPDGKLIGLLGPSGCGKSTTLYMICGLQKPSSGKIFFGEDDVTELEPENRGVGLVFQNYALYPHMTVKQNILFPLQNLKGEEKLPKDVMLERAVHAAKLVQIDNLLDRKPSELSGGQQQRVAIARALVKTPRVLLLDEPLSNLDARLRLQTREEIRRIQRETGVTTVFVTHDQEEAMSISDMIVVMKLGLVQQIGRPQDVYDDPANLFVAKFLGTPPINVFSGYVLNEKLHIGGEATPITKTETYEETVELEVGDNRFDYDCLRNSDLTQLLLSTIDPNAEDAQTLTEIYKYGSREDLIVLVNAKGLGVDQLSENARNRYLARKKAKTESNPDTNAKPKTVTVTRTREVVIGYDFHGGEAVLDVPGVTDREVYIGIRPEGFEVDDNGPMTCEVTGVDVMGRDVSIVSRHPAALVPAIRSIINADYTLAPGTKTVHYTLKPHKVFIFDKETEKRIYFGDTAPIAFNAQA